MVSLPRLFREFLLAELQQVEPEVIAKLHLRAADWYESNGSPALALEHLLATTERDRCVQLVTELALPTYQAGQMSTVQRWLATLGDSAIEEYPPLAVLAGWIAALTGQTADAQRWAAFVDTAAFDSMPVDGTASFESARAMLRACVSRRSRADGDRRQFGCRRGAAVEPVARHGARLVRRGAAAPRRQGAGARLFVETCAVGVMGGNVAAIVLGRAELRCWRWTAGDGRRRLNTCNLRSNRRRFPAGRLRPERAAFGRGPARSAPR